MVLSADAFKSVSTWNKRCSVGTKVVVGGSDDVFATSSKAMVLFGHKAAVYLESKKGFYPLSEVRPLS